MKKLKIYFISLFIIAILFPLIFMNNKQKQVSSIDNDFLPDFPKCEFEKFSQISSCLKKFENYLNKRIGFRENLTKFHSILSLKLFDNLEHPLYSSGKNGYIFPNINEEKLDKEFIEKFTDFLKNIEKYTKDRNIPFLYILNPNKKSIYSQYLPKGYNLKQITHNKILEDLKNKNITYLDNTNTLKNASKEIQVFDKKFDANHWNDNGAFIGIKEVINKLNEIYKLDLKEPQKSDYEIVTQKINKLQVFPIPINDETQIYKNKNSIKSDQKLYYDIKKSKNFTGYEHITNPNGNGKKLLYFRDSYSGKGQNFINNSFSEIYSIHSYGNVINFDYFINLFKPDVVLFQSVDYATIRRYFPMDKIESRIYNPNLKKFENFKIIERKINHSINISKNKIFQFSLDEKNINHAYLKIGNEIFDFTKNKDMAPYLDIYEENIKTNNYQIIIIDEKNGEKIIQNGKF